MEQKILAQGAEATIVREKDYIIKERIPKTYRIQQLDEKLRKARTKKEAKLLEKASKLKEVNTPRLLNQTEFNLEIEFIQGEKLAEHLNGYAKEKQLKVIKNLANQVEQLHKNDIIHGDLTTSNMILQENTSKLFLIDFGLGFISKRDEDKAVDLHVLKQALEAKHWQHYEELFQEFLKHYNLPSVKERLKIVESRGRYKH